MKLAIPITLLLLATAPRLASAQDVSFLLCFPGGPGSSADAQPVVDAFLGALKQSAGWTSVKGEYVNDAATCQAQMAKGGASVVVLPLSGSMLSRLVRSTVSINWSALACCPRRSSSSTSAVHATNQKSARLLTS